MDFDDMARLRNEIARLREAATLTDEEREAVAWCAEQWSGLKIAATLRGLLARLGGGA
jgi:hypothetical protein